MFAAAGSSQLYLLFGGGLGGAILIFYRGLNVSQMNIARRFTMSGQGNHLNRKAKWRRTSS
jgi:hypothetical protein